MRILPKDTEGTKYFLYKTSVIAKTQLPDKRTLLKIVHAWDDGEIMHSGFDYQQGDGPQSGLNPLHIIKIYNANTPVSNATMRKHIKAFLDIYYPRNECSNCDVKKGE